MKYLQADGDPQPLYVHQYGHILLAKALDNPPNDFKFDVIQLDGDQSKVVETAMSGHKPRFRELTFTSQRATFNENSLNPSINLSLDPPDNPTTNARGNNGYVCLCVCVHVVNYRLVGNFAWCKILWFFTDRSATAKIKTTKISMDG